MAFVPPAPSARPRRKLSTGVKVALVVVVVVATLVLVQALAAYYLYESVAGDLGSIQIPPGNWTKVADLNLPQGSGNVSFSTSHGATEFFGMYYANATHLNCTIKDPAGTVGPGPCADINSSPAENEAGGVFVWTGVNQLVLSPGVYSVYYTVTGSSAHVVILAE